VSRSSGVEWVPTIAKIVIPTNYMTEPYTIPGDDCHILGLDAEVPVEWLSEKIL
jgi:hypothetical protein